MEKVVYFLGAGFSAPLGIPVMKNFFEKSKDIYFSDKQKYKGFLDVINTFNKFNLVKSFYNTNLFNIEELLSILEMTSGFERRKIKKTFLDYISDVISYYTPKLEYEYYNNESIDLWFRKTQGWSRYLKYFASMLHLEFDSESIHHPDRGSVRLPRFHKASESEFRYDIISLNYDLVFEECRDYINKFTNDKNIVISRLPSSKEKYPCDIYLSKLHGSIDDKNIVPPTWNKSLRTDIKSYWELASQLLKEANHIRFIGYSLPDSDSYVKYLLKSSITEDQNLKTIDVICYDPDGSVKKRYDEFIVFPNYSFISAKTEDYLDGISVKEKSYDSGRGVVTYKTYNTLETHHNIFRAKHN